MLYLIIILLILFLFLKYKKQNKIELSPEETKRIIENREFDYLVDVRTLQEWNEGHHPLAIHIPIGDFVTLLPEKIPNKNARIIFYCKKGYRASGTVEIAKKLGYKNIKYVDGRYIDL